MSSRLSGSFPLALLYILLASSSIGGSRGHQWPLWGFLCPVSGWPLLYPLTLALAMGAAGTRADTASARAALAGTLGILVTPALLGA